MSNPYEPGIEKPNPMKAQLSTAHAIRGAVLGAFFGFGSCVLGLVAMMYFSSAAIGVLELLIVLVVATLMIILPAAVIGAVISVAVGSYRRTRSQA